MEEVLGVVGVCFWRFFFPHSTPGGSWQKLGIRWTVVSNFIIFHQIPGTNFIQFDGSHIFHPPAIVIRWIFDCHYSTFWSDDSKLWEFLKRHEKKIVGLFVFSEIKGNFVPKVGKERKQYFWRLKDWNTWGICSKGPEENSWSFWDTKRKFWL